MRTTSIACVLLAGLGGCMDVNPEWDTPVAAAHGEEEAHCDSPEGESEDDDEEGDAAEDACGAIGPDEPCGGDMTQCWTDNGWFCADLEEHDEHCGACFNECAAYGDATCQQGECACKGGPWMQLCSASESCVDTRFEPTGCGILCVDCRVEQGPDAVCDMGIFKPA